jgi:hypothetical protein
MSWTWLAGHIFFRLEAQTTRGFSAHVGSNGCSMDSTSGRVEGCTQPNRASVVLDGFSLERSVVVLDLQALLDGMDVDGQGCRSEPGSPQCDVLFGNLGVPGDSGEPSRAFRLEQRP